VHRFLFQDHSGGHSGITSSRTSVHAQVFYMSPGLFACGSEL
jgi:hypothetical protein